MWGRTRAAVGKFWNSLGGVMHTQKKFEIIKKIRTATVLGIGTFGTLAASWLIGQTLRSYVNAGATVNDLAATVLGGVLISAVMIALFCLLAFHFFYFFESTTLSQAIRLGEAMRMLHATTHQKSRETLRFYRISVFRAKEPLGEGVEENVPCRLISTFLSPWAFRSDQNAAFGSTNHCCDYEQIQRIIDGNKEQWGEAAGQSEDAGAKIVALEQIAEGLREKLKKRTAEYTAASGREGRLKKQMEDVENHMAVLVELANKVTNEVKPPRTITEDEIKAKYRTIGKIYGIDKVPSTYVDIFRKNMPKEIINWGGAPKQGSVDEET